MQADGIKAGDGDVGMSVAVAGWPHPGRSRRLPPSVLVSLVAHGLLLSLTFGGDGAGRAGLGLPWQAEATDLRVVLNADVAPPAVAAPPVPEVLAPALSREAAKAPGDEAPEVLPPPPPVDAPPVLAVERPVAAAWAVPAASAASAVPPPVVATMASASSPAVERLTRPREPRLAQSEREAGEHTAELARVEAERQQIKAAPSVFAAASGTAVEALRRPAPATRAPVAIDARERSAELAQLDASRLEIRSAPAVLSAASAPAVQALRRASESLRPRETRERSAELASLEASRLDGAQGVQQVEAARAEGLRQEAARADAARQDAARAEAARQAAARQEASRLEAVRQEGLRIEAARLAAAQAQAQAQAQAEEEQREARKRAIGRQLDAEAAQRDADRKRPDWVPARRGRLLGRIDANAELAAYGETWGRKIESNITVETARDVARQPHTDAVVTVAVRSNGSVESITFVRSSGVPAVDEAITRIVRSQENYPAFPAALLKDFDVVEIRRTWHFDMAVRLY
ncbi:TonB family protein [Roseateles sp. LYH14W]|uniref:TonB family protein n=1 Tax=Pelomonas parva TaxID=3299032 RepID=A0ABW7F8R7_9BURK